ncbi:hypothetical protein QG37_02919 [Candidozyma auris]|uniref:Uncharacterized protein n=1 Tax=Candidozyma auris TaxID=498019 RepID=A0A0L0P1U7_CANAR|nr:hypothetical protein QG37_02919 [[Candida] auris]
MEVGLRFFFFGPGCKMSSTIAIQGEPDKHHPHVDQIAPTKKKKIKKKKRIKKK